MIVVQSKLVDEYCDVIWPDKLTKDGQTIFVKTDFITVFLKKALKGPFKFKLVTGYSDFSPTTFFDDDILDIILDNSLLIEWRAQNVLFSHPKVRHLPIGLEASTVKFCEENHERLRSIPKKDDVYYNFNVDTNSPERSELMIGLYEKKDFETYMWEMASYKYVMCPMGNGIDTHRFWEAQVCGCIPIIRCPEEFLPTYEGFPYISLPGICNVRLGAPSPLFNVKRFSKFELKV